MTNIKERISKITASLIIQHPFFGIFLSSTNIIEDNNIPTAATDGIHIYYNSSFLEQLEDSEIKGVFIHEVFHMIYSHCDRKRRGIRNHRKYNKAADYCINWEIQEIDPNKIKLPHNIIINGKPFKVFLDHKYRNMLVEKIYELLADDPNDDSDGFDIHIDMPIDEEKKQEVEDRIIAAYEMTNNGNDNIPKGIKRAIDEIKQAQVPWTRVFQRYVGNALLKDDYSYSMPNRRFISEELYMPSLSSYKIGRIGVFPDMSGSIDAAEASAFATELRKISALISEIVVGCWDTKVHTWETIKDMSNLEKALKFKCGGGGTSVSCVFDEIKKRKEFFDLIIILTDGYYGKLPPKKNINCPVIFVMTTNNIAEWGNTIQIKV